METNSDFGHAYRLKEYRMGLQGNLPPMKKKLNIDEAIAETSKFELN